jgi:hypothetical protein
MLNHHLSQKLKLIGNDEFNHSINILTLSSRMGSNYPLISEVQHKKYLIEIGGE